MMKVGAGRPRTHKIREFKIRYSEYCPNLAKFSSFWVRGLCPDLHNSSFIIHNSLGLCPDLHNSSFILHNSLGLCPNLLLLIPIFLRTMIGMIHESG